MRKIFHVEEHQEIHDKIAAGDYQGALTILETLDEMNSGDLTRKIRNRMARLLQHFIKLIVQPEKVDRSWFITIGNQVDDIAWANKCANNKGFYLDYTKLAKTLDEAYSIALRYAIGEMRCSANYASSKVNRQVLIDRALKAITNRQKRLK